MQAAAAGDGEAMAHLGHMHANGHGTPKSYTAAVEWWSKAAKRNNPSAVFGLAYAHLMGRGVQQASVCGASGLLACWLLLGTLC